MATIHTSLNTTGNCKKAFVCKDEAALCIRASVTKGDSAIDSERAGGVTKPGSAIQPEVCLVHTPYV